MSRFAVALRGDVSLASEARRLGEAALAEYGSLEVRADVPVGWIGRPEHIADAVLFLLRNDYVTGQVLNISGGRMIGL